MPRPGVEITTRAQPLPRSAPTDTGVWFVVGSVKAGSPSVPTLITSLAQYEQIFGARTDGTVLYDALDAYWRNGGGKAYVAGVSGATPDPIAALDLFNPELGPGQVSIPGAADTASHEALLDHAMKCNRVALCDSAGDEDATALEALTTPLATLDSASFGSLWAPWAILPGVTAGTTREVPWSAVQAGLITRNDGLNLNPNVPAAGINGVTTGVMDLTSRFTVDEYEALNDAGVDMARVVYGGIEAYGYRSLVDPDGADAAWLNFGNCRLRMAITAQSNAIAERYVFAQMDGRGKKTAQFGGDLRGMLTTYYERDALYGATFDDACYVDVGSNVNTPATMANGELHAVIEVRMSPFAELVVIEIVKVAITEALAA